jgi:uncharacterized membrane protein
MSRYQKLTLIIGALILVAVIALIAVTALKPSAQTFIPTSTQQLSAHEMTGTFVYGMMFSNSATHQAFETAVKQTATSP